MKRFSPIVILVIIAVAAILLVAATADRFNNTDSAWHAAAKTQR